MAKDWYKLSEERGGCFIHPLALGMRASAYTGQIVYDLLGKPEEGFFLDSLTTFEKGTAVYHFKEDEFDRAASELFRGIKEDPSIAKKIAQKHIEYGRKLMNLGEKLEETGAKDLPDKKTREKLEEYFKNLNKLWAWGIAISILEYKEALLSEEIAQKLEELSDEPQKHLQVLLTPTKETYFRKEKVALLRIAQKAQENDFLDHFEKHGVDVLDKDHPIAEQLKSHNQKFSWLNYFYAGPATSPKEHLEELVDVLQDNPRKKLEKVLAEFKKIEAEQKKIQKKLDLSEDIIRLIEVTKEFTYLKAYRKEVLYHAFHYIDIILKEVSRRKNIPMKHIRQMYPEELLGLLLNDHIQPEEHYIARHEFSVYIVEEGHARILVGPKAKNIIQSKEEEITKKDKLVGKPASLGKASGAVKIVNNVDDISKVEEGDILVSISTNPTLVPAMRRAGAIVTDIGGVTCHAAIVSRELDKPCLVGTKEATKVFADGDVVEVDADKGAVRLIK